MAEFETRQPETETPDTRARLLEAAGQVFAEAGFDGTSVRDVCERAGVKNVGAVNYYFRSKENLYEEALRNAFQCPFTRLPAPHWPEGTPPLVKLHDFIRGMILHILGDGVQPWQMTLLMRELQKPGPAGERLVRDMIRPINEILWGLLREILPAVDERRLHLIGFSIVGQCFYHRFARPVIRLVVGQEEHASYDARVLAEHIVNFSLAALGLARLGEESS